MMLNLIKQIVIQFETCERVLHSFVTDKLINDLVIVSGKYIDDYALQLKDLKNKLLKWSRILMNNELIVKIPKRCSNLLKEIKEMRMWMNLHCRHPSRPT